MTTGDLIQRCWAHLGQGATTFYPAQPLTPGGISPLVDNGLNVAQRLLVLLKPALLVQRVTVTLVPDQVNIDLRDSAPRLLRFQRLVLGDVTGATPVLTQGKVGDLRETTVEALRSQKDWYKVRRAFPDRYYRHGVHLVCTYPRSIQTITVTLVYNALPTALSVLNPTQVPDLPIQQHELIADVAAEILRLTEGGGTCEEAMQRLSMLLQQEPLFQPLLKKLRAERYKTQAPQQKAVV